MLLITIIIDSNNVSSIVEMSSCRSRKLLFDAGEMKLREIHPVREKVVFCENKWSEKKAPLLV